MLFSADEFAVSGLNPEAQQFFDHVHYEQVTSCLLSSLGRLITERLCMAARPGGAYIKEMPVHLTMADNSVRLTQITVLPIAVSNRGPRSAVLILRHIPDEPLVHESYAKLPRELLTGLPMPAWFVDSSGAVPFQNPACRDLPMGADQGPMGVDLTAALKERRLDELQIETEYVKALRSTSKIARERRLIADAMVSAAGQVWRVVHLPITGVDSKPYLLGFAIQLSKNLDGSTLDLPMGAGINEDEARRKIQARARERERIKLAREVHDSLGQELTVLRLGLDRVFDMIHAELPVTPAHVEQFGLLKGQMQQVISSSRQIAYQLRNDLVASAGLMYAINDLVRQVEKSLAGQLEVSPGWEEPKSNVLSANIYRSTQELLNNAIKHAKASKFLVRLTHLDSDYRLEVVDDGIGIPRERRERSLGMKTLRERVEYHHGTMSIKTRPDVAGTSVVLTFPGAEPTGFNDSVL